MTERSCAFCEARFTVKSSKPDQKYCSKLCSDKGRRRKPDKECLICGKAFVSARNSPGKYCSTVCRDIGRRRQESRDCLHCGKPFIIVQSRPKKYCSQECAIAVNGPKMKKQYPIQACETCGKEFTHKRYDLSGKYCSYTCWTKRPSTAKPWPSKECAHCGQSFLYPPWNPETKCCSKECGNRYRSTWMRGDKCYQYKGGKVKVSCTVCGKEKMVHPYRAETTRTCSRRCTGLLNQINMPRTSSLERTMCDALTGIGLSPEPQYVVGYYTLDLALPDYQLAIECDGEYWHNTPKQKSKDKAKDTYLNGKGWQVVRLPERDIKKSPQKCVEVVLNKMTSILGGVRVG